MKILLIGPYPPPHGGISTHISELERRWKDAGVPCRVLDTGHVGARLGWQALRYGLNGWTLHVHTNGHNPKSWLLAGLCGVVGGVGKDATLTLHSGMVPRYLAAKTKARATTRLVCSLYRRIVCASTAIRDALVDAGVPSRRLEVRPAFIAARRAEAPLNPLLRAWMGRHSPMFSTTLFFRPEYGFELLVASLTKLRRSYPSLGCVVMGSGEQQAEADRLVRASGLQDAIFLAGDVSHSTCLGVMSASDLFLRPTFEDGDSVSVREALALGVPVVASEAGTRPAGTVLFRTGDGDDLCAKVHVALKQHDHVSV